MKVDRFGGNSDGDIRLSTIFLLLIIAALIYIILIISGVFPGKSKLDELKNQFLTFAHGEYTSQAAGDKTAKQVPESKDAETSENDTASADGEIQPRIPENNGERSDSEVKSWY